MSYAERVRRKMMRAQTPAELHHGRCGICMAHIQACGPRCWHRRNHRCQDCAGRGRCA